MLNSEWRSCSSINGTHTAVQKENGTSTVLTISKKSTMADIEKTTALSPGHPLGGERVLRIPPWLNKCEKIKIYNRVTRVATWNVRSLYMTGKLENVEAEMKRLNVDILGMSEVRWPGSGQKRTEGGYIYWAGDSGPSHRHGVAVLLKASIASSVMDFVPLNNRIMLLKLGTSHRVMNIIQTYAPTCDGSEEEIEEFYNGLEEVMKLTKTGEITFVLGDFNAKVGLGAEGEVVGNNGLGERNSRGDRLVRFCGEHGLVITNTFFKLHPRRLYTWRSPADKEDRVVRNQIDFILAKSHLKRYVKSVKTYPGADVYSDHNPVVMEFRLQRFFNIRKQKPGNRIDIDDLKNIEKNQRVGMRLEEEMNKLERTNGSNEAEDIWRSMATVMSDIQQNEIGFKNNKKKQGWMTDEILQLMEERRGVKTKDNTKYKAIQNIIRKKCREAREEWLTEKCREIETLQEKYDTFNLHKKVKEMAGKQRNYQKTLLKNDRNEIVTGVEEKLKVWKEYVEGLFNDNRQDPSTPDSETNESSPVITKCEVIHALKLQKNGKATGPDKIHAETLKLLLNEEGSGLNLLTSLFNSVYRTGQIPADWLRSTFVTLPKKARASVCDDYRMISLMSHVLKTFLRIIHTRIYKKCESQIDQTQFGFRNGMGTREALFSLNVLTQRCRDMNVDVYACFIDYRKAFDCVSHNKMIDILKATGIDKEDIQIITKLYWYQTAQVQIEQMTSDDISIRKGVRQGCVLSPLLFNLYSETIFKEALHDESAGITINGTVINNIRYADDTVVVGGSLRELQELINKIVHHSEQFGLFMNISKTKLMIFSKRNTDEFLTIHGSPVEQVTSIKYLGAIVDNNCDPKKEIRSRIEQARQAFISMRTFFTRSDLSLELRMRMLRCYVFSVLLYGCESWTLDPVSERRIEAFEMYCYRRLLRISWVERVTNLEVLNRVQKGKEILMTIKERKLQYFGHVMRGEKYEILRLIIEGKVSGKRSVGRRRNSWMRDLRRWYAKTSCDIFRAAVSKITIARWIANLRTETA